MMLYKTIYLLILVSRLTKSTYTFFVISKPRNTSFDVHKPQLIIVTATIQGNDKLLTGTCLQLT